MSRRPRETGSTSFTPNSRSALRSCCDTADGVRCVASATAASVPRTEISLSRNR